MSWQTFYLTGFQFQHKFGRLQYLTDAWKAYQLFHWKTDQLFHRSFCSFFQWPFPCKERWHAAVSAAMSNRTSWRRSTWSAVVLFTVPSVITLSHLLWPVMVVYPPFWDWHDHVHFTLSTDGAQCSSVNAVWIQSVAVKYQVVLCNLVLLVDQAIVEWRNMQSQHLI